VLVIGQYLDQLDDLAASSTPRLVTGKTPVRERQRLFDEFRSGDLRVLVVSKVANFSIDLPQARVAIQVSGTFGSRQEEAQRLGRVLRPKTDGRTAHFYTSRHAGHRRRGLRRQTAAVSGRAGVRLSTSWTPRICEPAAIAADLGVDSGSMLCAEWAHKRSRFDYDVGRWLHMMIEKTIGVPAPRVVPSPARDAMNETADRLVLEVVSAVDDGYTGVPECQRLIAWLGAEFLPYATARYPDPPADLVELTAVLDEMHGSNGEIAAQLSLQARSLVFRLL
jgi:hypothetical protein